MTPQFLRSEAARFREMAEQVTDREASRQRLLGMAIDYEARAAAADADPLGRAATGAGRSVRGAGARAGTGASARDRRTDQAQARKAAALAARVAPGGA